MGRSFQSQCSVCHGERGEGGIGPKLIQTKLSLEKFAKIVRTGSGMMPSIPGTTLGDVELKTIHDQLAAAQPVQGGGGGNPLGKLLTRTMVVRIAHGSLIIMALGFARLIFFKYNDWTAYAFGKKYYAKLGWLRIFGLFISVLVIDVLAVGSLFKRQPIRWLIHGLLVYGFFSLIVADVLIAIYNPQRLPMVFLSPFKLLANLSGLLLLVGSIVVGFRMIFDPYENNGISFGRDLAFVAILMIVTLSGFLTEGSRYLLFPQLTVYFYFVHILAVAALFISAPFTRFEHIISTLVLVFSTKLAGLVASEGQELAFAEEPAPGRHHKTEKIAASLIEKLNLPGQITTRYFP